MIFTAGLVLFIIGKILIAMNLSVLAIGDVSNGVKIGVVLAMAGSVLILISLSILAWSYLP